MPQNGGQQRDSGDYAKLQGRIRFAMVSSLIANVLLLAAKIVAFVLSQSKSVLASAADSFVDIASQVTSAILNHLHEPPAHNKELHEQ